jgi:carbonic anhydrase
MAQGKFATTINCMDGRTQLPVIGWLKQELAVDYVDSITEPGADRQLAEGSLSQRESVRAKVAISVEKHGSRAVAIVAHHDCAGNPVAREQHLKHLAAAARNVQTWGLPVRILTLWIGERWEVELVSDTGEQG